MSHGSQRALVLTASLETRTTGVHTIATDPPNFRTTRAHTPLPKYLKMDWSGTAAMDGRSLAQQVQSPMFWLLSILSTLSVL